jgi:hypothetical protein
VEPAYRVSDDIYALRTYFPVPALGMVPVNAFVLQACEPVLIDTGLIAEHDQFMATLESVMDPRDLRWLWLTHPDPDHVGSLQQLVTDNPHLRVITTFLGFGMLSLFCPLPPDRIFLLNPGQTLDVGDRTLLAVKPPTFDNPATTAVFDVRSGALFSSDCFGAVLAAPAEQAGDLSPADLRQGQLLWGSVDSPWVSKVQRPRFSQDLATLGQLEPKLILSSHLPPARGLTQQLLANLELLPDAPPFTGPDQAAMERMLAELTAVPA